MKKTKTILNKIILAVFFSICLLTSCSKGNIANKMLDRLAAESNRLCPMEVDYITRCDSITHPVSLTLAYYYTLAVTAEELDSLQMDWNKVKAQIVSSVNNNLQLAPLLAFNVKFRHTYFDSEGQEIYQTEIVPADYKDK